MDNTNIIIGIDHGNFQIKTKHCIFPAGIYKYGSQNTKVKDKDVLGYNNEYYAVTKRHNGISRDKTIDDRYYILTMFAIVKELESRNLGTGNYNVTLAVGLPPSQLNENSCNEFEKYLKKNRIVRLTYNGKIYNIVIKDVYIFAQGIGAIAAARADHPIFEFQHFLIIDIGGGTTEYIAFDNGSIDPAKCNSIDEGTITIAKDITKSIAQKYNFPIYEQDIELTLENKKDSLLLPENIRADIKKAYFDKAVHFIILAREEQLDPRTWPVFLTGGGSHFVKDQFTPENEVRWLYFNDEIKANAIGFEILATAKCAKK